MSFSVAVIIPTYNRAKEVQVAIQSLLAQTRVPDEIIVVDDGSTDNTRDILKRYDAPVRVVGYRPNRGPSAARNAGLEIATSDLIAFLDSDDTLPPDSIERRVEALTAHPGYEVVYGDAWLVDEAGQRCGTFSQKRPGERPSGDVFAAFALHNLFPPHVFMFHRACLQKTGLFDTTLRALEDHDFWLRMAAHFRFMYLDGEPLANYHIHSSMTTLTALEMMRVSRVIVQKRAIDMPAFATLPADQKARIYAFHGANCAVVLGETQQARRWIWQAIRSRPTYARAYLYLLMTLLGRRGLRALNTIRRAVNRRKITPGGSL